MIVDDYQNLLALALAGDETALMAVLEEMPPADIAELIDDHFVLDEAMLLIERMSRELRAEVFGYLRPNSQQQLASAMDVGSLSRLFRDMSADERADLYALLDIKRQDAVMRRLAESERDDLLRLTSYEEGTVGSIMTSDYAVIPATASVEMALRHLRQSAPEKETIYQAYVVDNHHRLQGVVSLRDLITAAPNESIEDLMATDIVTVTPDMPRAESARIISRYDLIAIPVVSEEQLLVGIVTFDDAMDVVEEQDTDTMHKSATVGKLEGGLRDASVFMLYRKRINWLVLLVFANIFSGAGIAYFEDTISSYIALLFFLPLLIASGGNAGSQAATLMVRGLATGEVSTSDWLVMMGKELLVSSGLGLTMALAITIVGSFRVGPEIILVVATSMVIIVLVGSMIGFILPFILHRLKWDPATASAPLVTTIADSTGVLVYFSIATAVLGMPNLTGS